VRVISTSTGTDIAIPTAFSPNGDRQNDLFFPIVRTGSGVTIKEFRVFNRWGALLYNNPLTGWDGNFKTELQPTEIYVYFVKYNVPGKGDESKTGSFSLLK
jgi:gliding motility-associated-like protein